MDATPQQQPSAAFPVVGIGASAGGIVALRQFFDHLPAGSGMAFVVILHLMREKESTLAALLQKHTTMPVRQVTERIAVAPDHVYVIPPEHDLSMTDGHLSLSERPHQKGQHAPADLFLRTLAQAQGEQAVGIVLSGSGSDGTLGLQAIKEAGGLAIVQDADEAEYSGMPRSAIERSLVDLVLPVQKIAEKLVTYQRHAERIRLPDADALPKDDSEVLRKILTQLRSQVGHDFTHYKQSTFLRRLNRRMHITGVETLAAYLGVLRHNGEEATALFKDLLISVTNFFRDPEAFEILAQVVPAFFEGKNASDQVRVWVPGCATGEEAYSLAMLLAEHASLLDAPPKIQIFATDIDEDALAKARAGVYLDSIATDVSEERLQRFFNREGDHYRVKKELREHILFATHNLLRDPPFSKLDLITSRNLLIYLNRDMHERVFELFHYALRAGGHLFLGNSESADSIHLFRSVDKQARLYQRREVPRQAPNLPDLPLTYILPRKTYSPLHKQAQGEPQASSFGEMHQQMLEQYAPPSVVVNEQYDIVHLSPTAGRYLQITGGTPSMNILKVARKELQGALRTVLFQALRERQPAVARSLEVPIDGEVRLVDVIVRPAEDNDFEGFALVLFSEIAVTQDQPNSETTPDLNPALHHLETELHRTRERLQATVEEFESSREEMKAQNEELQSVNEEYKTTTEELETSKEELQSVNEELQTVNQELKNKIDEVSQAHNDLQNLMAATEIATLFLDRDLRIKRFTPRTTELFNIVVSDRGRPLSHITHRFDYSDLQSDTEQVLRTLVPVEKEIPTWDGRWFYVTLRPYRTAEDRIEGIVLTFVDFTSRRAAEEATRQSEEQYRLVIDSIREYAVFTMDADGVVVTWNDEAERVLGWQEEDIVDQPLDVIFTEEDRDANAPAQELHTARAQGNASDDRWHVRKDGTRFWANGVLSAMYAEDGSLRGFVKVLRDNTARKKAAEELKRITEQAERQLAIFDKTLTAISDFVYVFDREGRFMSVNRPLLDLWGLRLDQAVGKNFYDLSYPEPLAEKLHGQIDTVFETGQTVKDETPYTSPTGQSGYYEYIFTPVFDDHGSVATVAGSTRDISDRKAVEAALHEAKVRFQTVAENVPDILFMADTSAGLEMEYLSPRWAEFTGMAVEEGIDQWPTLLHTDDRARMVARWRQARETNAHFEDRLRLHTATDTFRWVLVRAQAIEDVAGQATRWFGTVTDINSLVEAEQAIQDLNETLEERVRIRTEQVRSLTAALTLAEQHERQRIAQILHDDLQQMLYGMELATQQLRRFEDPAKQALYLDQMNEILDQAIDTTRSLTVELSPPVLRGEGLKSALEWLVVWMEQVHHLDVRLHTQGATAQYLDKGQRLLLYQTVRELLFNIVKHAGVERADVHLSSTDDQLVILVSDEGRGFDAAAVLHGKESGTGLGLSSMQERLALFGGQLTIDTQPASGTAITITLPFSLDEDASEQ